MLKKSLLIGSAVLLVSSPLLVASDWTQDPKHWNTVDCGNWSFTGVSGTENFQTLSGPGSKTATASIMVATGGILTISTSGNSLSQNKAAFGLSDLSENSDGWRRISQASHVTTANIKDDVGATGSRANLIGISGQSGGETLTVAFSGLSQGKSYSVALFFTTTRGSGSDYAVNVKSETSGVNWSTVEYGYMATNSGRDTWMETGTLATGLDFSDSYGFGSVAAGVYAEFTYNGSDGNLEIKLEQGVRSIAQIQMINISEMIIPEPSAFGLLAGVGALALTVSRRKRSRRS